MKKTNNIMLLLCFFLIFVSSSNAYAKNEPPQPKSDAAPNPGLPIDGGVVYLLVSGVIYGVFKLKNKK